MTQYARDLDYEYALFLQKQFEVERKNSKKTAVTNDSMSAVVVASHSKSGKIDLADPHLELTDPTPNVHALFIQFDANFFWKRLGSVAVRWSKRMYSCAGICRYESRGGMCDIALSEPLLKLRPRKDLIETLLHEMIHAYLFLTDNNRDRNGHGPKFHEHMYRINKAANINITVYHTFIDEVQLYKTHWWRCNGPCHTWKPFFGIVRRSSNRAPGPSDFWWQSHQMKCSGTFIKIKEPEKKKTSVKEGKEDKAKVNNPKGLQDIGKFLQPKITSGPSKVVTLQDLTNSSSSYSNKGNNFSSSPPKQIVKPNSNTVKGSTKTVQLEESNKSVIDLVREHWAKRYANSHDKQDTIDKDKVRNHWATKYTASSEDINKHVKKSRKSENSITIPSKRSKYDNMNNTITNYIPNFKSPEKVEHENILKDIYGDTFKLNDKFIKKDGEANKQPNQAVSKSSIQVMVDCPSCSKSVKEIDINDHLDLCISPVVSNLNDRLNPSIQMDTSDNKHFPKAGMSECLCNPDSKTCGKSGNNCLNQKSEYKISVSDDYNTELDSEINLDDELFNCPVCNKTVTKSMNHHLEDCVSNFFEGESENIPESSEDDTVNLISDDELDESQEFNNTGTKFPCPCCLKMIEQESMNVHLDGCLGK